MQGKPTTFQRDLAKLPRALAPLQARPQWVVWRWTRQKDRWQKPPFMPKAPERHASTKDPSTWADYATALAAVQAGQADGVSYVLTESDPFAAMDIDHCRDPETGSLDTWAMNFLDVARHTYSEVTPSGSGVRVWGLTGHGTAPINRKFTLEIDGKPIAAELFRRTPKALTITGYKLDSVRELANVDDPFQWAVVWGERRKAAEAATQVNSHSLNGHSFNGGGGHDVEEIERLVREGAGDANRSDKFHAIIGHYIGCGWGAEQIHEHLRQSPEGIAGRYLSEGRLAREISRSVGKYEARMLPLFNGHELPETLAREVPSRDTSSPATPPLRAPPIPEPTPAQTPEPVSPDPDDDPELGDPELGDEEFDDDELEEKPNPKLPPLYAHGDPDPRPLKSWLIKGLLSSVGHGLLSGQWGTYKTFVAFDLAMSLMTGQPFLGHSVKRQCGVLLIAAEGASEVRLRLEAVIRNKCGDMERAPFRWYETTPLLLQKGAVETLTAMARQADASLRAEFGLPLGLVVIDTIAACAGYPKAGDENDSAAAQAVMNVLKAVAEALGCFVLGVDHFGKSVESGTRGSGAKESASDLVLACLGDKELSGSVTNTRLAVRKNRGGQQGQEFPFTPRVVAAPEPDEDGEPITSMVVDWQPNSPGGNQPRPGPDPWAVGRTQDQRTVILRLKRVLMSILAERGVDLPIPPDGPMVRMVDQEIVREQFYRHTPAEGTPKQKRQLRSQQFKRALGRAEEEQLLGVGEIDDVTYLWLSRPQEEDELC